MFLFMPCYLTKVRGQHPGRKVTQHLRTSNNPILHVAVGAGRLINTESKPYQWVVIGSVPSLSHSKSQMEKRRACPSRLEHWRGHSNASGSVHHSCENIGAGWTLLSSCTDARRRGGVGALITSTPTSKQHLLLQPLSALPEASRPLRKLASGLLP